MKTTQLLEERRVDSPTPQLDSQELAKLARNPRKAALLSILPGLGQLYNGETSKGVLFLIVSAVTVGFFGMAIAWPSILAFLPQMNLKPNEEIVYILNQARTTQNLLLWVGMFIVYALYAGREAYDNAVKSRQGAHYARFYFGLSESSSGSYIIHLSALLVMICIGVASIAIPPAPQVTKIDMVLEPPKVEPPPPPPPPPPKHKPAPKPKALTPKPDVQPKKPAPAPKAAPKVVSPVPIPDLPKTDAPSPIPAPSGPPDPGPVATNPGTGGGTGPGVAGGGGGGDGDGKDVDLSAYLAEMERRIKSKWYPPKGNESKKIVVSFKLNSQGSVSKIRLISSSRLAIADDAATTAIKDGSPFGPLPDGAPDVVSIRFTFDYDVFSGRASVSR